MRNDNTLKVGDTCYIFDINHRVYARDENGRAHSGPIYREHFKPYVIMEDVARSWMIAPADYPTWSRKVSKKSVLSKHDVDERCWLNSDRHKIVRLVESCQDVEKLRAIAAIIGYEA